MTPRPHLVRTVIVSNRRIRVCRRCERWWLPGDVDNPAAFGCDGQQFISVRTYTDRAEKILRQKAST